MITPGAVSEPVQTSVITPSTISEPTQTSVITPGAVSEPVQTSVITPSAVSEPVQTSVITAHSMIPETRGSRSTPALFRDHARLVIRDNRTANHAANIRHPPPTMITETG